MKLISWEEINKKLEVEDLTPLEQFIYDNEPAGQLQDYFRNQLSDALTDFAAQESKQVSLEFAEWTMRNNWRFNRSLNTWYNERNSKYLVTTSELFNLFQSERETK